MLKFKFLIYVYFYLYLLLFINLKKLKNFLQILEKIYTNQEYYNIIFSCKLFNFKVKKFFFKNEFLYKILQKIIALLFNF